MAVPRKTETRKFGSVERPDDESVTVVMEALAFEKAEDLLPEITNILSAVFDRLAPAFAAGTITGEDDVLAMLPALGALANQLTGGKLKQLSAAILTGTSVTMPDQEGVTAKYDLVKKEDRGDCFDLRPDLYLKILFFAGKVTFGPFFPVGSLLKTASKSKKKASPTQTPEA